LAELCEAKLPTYYINSADKILSKNLISHCNWRTKEEMVTENYLPANDTVKILLTSGASCPDALVEEVISRLLEFYPSAKTVVELTKEFL